MHIANPMMTSGKGLLMRLARDFSAVKELHFSIYTLSRPIVELPSLIFLGHRNSSWWVLEFYFQNPFIN
jgi:hypothetical protein